MVASSNYSAYSMTDGTTEIAQGSSRYPNIVSTPICGIYNAASVASTTIKIQFKSIAGGNAIIDGSSSNAIEWSIYALDQTFPSPLLVGSITSNSTGAEIREGMLHQHAQRLRVQLRASAGSLVNKYYSRIDWELFY